MQKLQNIVRAYKKFECKRNKLQIPRENFQIVLERLQNQLQKSTKNKYK